MTRLVHLVFLVAIWILLWSDPSAANLVSGVVVAGAVVVVFRSRSAGDVVLRPLAAISLLGFFLVQLIRSTFDVARAVIAPRRHVHTGIVAVPLEECSDAIATLVADAISLTPGTLSIDLRRDPLTVYVHCLDARDPEQLHLDVRRLQTLAVNAFGSRSDERRAS